MQKSGQLVKKVNNNEAELYMSILSRFTSGKRMNLVSRGSFQNRCILSGLRYNKSFLWHRNPWKIITKKSPGTHFKNFMAKRMAEKRRKSDKPTARRKLFKIVEKKPNLEYGPNAEQPEKSDEDVAKEINELIQDLKVRVGNIEICM